MLRTVTAVLVAVALACASAPRRIRLHEENGAEIVFTPANGGHIVPVEDRELRAALRGLASDVPTPAHALSWAERQFRVPERSGTYLYEVRTGRLMPAVPGGPLVGAVSEAEFVRDYFEWCQTSEEEPGDCLRLLTAGAHSFSSHARYAVAMAMGWDATLRPMKEELRGMVSASAIRATVVSAMAMYLMLWALPEPVSKGIAAAMTVFLLGYLGLDGLLKLADAWRALVDEADQAKDFDELREIGDRFGARAGPALGKIVMLVATVAIGTGGGLAAKGPSLPGFSQAALQAEAQGGIRLLAAGAVETVVVGQSTVTISLAPGALAMAASGPGTGGVSPRYTAENFRQNLIKLAGIEPKGAHAHHVFPQLLELRLRELGINIHDPRYGAWWKAPDHLQRAAQYNAEWLDFMGSAHTQADIFKFARAIAQKYGLQIYF